MNKKNKKNVIVGAHARSLRAVCPRSLSTRPWHNVQTYSPWFYSAHCHNRWTKRKNDFLGTQKITKLMNYSTNSSQLRTIGMQALRNNGSRPCGSFQNQHSFHSSPLIKLPVSQFAKTNLKNKTNLNLHYSHPVSTFDTGSRAQIRKISSRPSVQSKDDSNSRIPPTTLFGQNKEHLFQLEKNLDLSAIDQFLRAFFFRLKENDDAANQTSPGPPKRIGNHALLKEVANFDLEIKTSSIVNSGKGVYLQGEVDVGKVVGIYPGTIFFPGDPLLIPSLFNSYLLRRSDGITIDGKYFGISGSIFRNCSDRDDFFFGGKSCDSSWTQLKEKDLDQVHNPLAIGHLINHFPEGGTSNVMYYEYNFGPEIFVPILRKYFPYTFYNSENFFRKSLPGLLMISTRKILDEELFSDYGFIGNNYSS